MVVKFNPCQKRKLRNEEVVVLNKEKFIEILRSKNFTDGMIDDFKEQITEEELKSVLSKNTADEFIEQIKEGYGVKELNPKRSYAKWGIISTAHPCMGDIDVEIYKSVGIQRIIEDCGLKYDQNGTKARCFAVDKNTEEPVLSFIKDSKGNIKKYNGKDLLNGTNITAAMLLLSYTGLDEFEDTLQREYGINVENLREAADKSAESQVTFIQRNMETYKIWGDASNMKQKKVLNCVVEPKYIDKGQDGLYLTFDVASNKMNHRFDGSYTIYMADFTSKKRFTDSLPAFTFTGSEDDLFMLKDFITDDCDIQYRDMINTVGLHHMGGKWLYIDNKGYFDAEGNSGDDMVAAIHETQKETYFREAEKINAEEIKKIWRDLFKYNSYEICTNVLLATIALYMKEIHNEFGGLNTPHMNFCGESGSGKSGTMERIFNPLFCLHPTKYNKTASGSTPFALTKESSFNNTLPIIINEFKKDGLTDTRFKQIFDLLRNAYDKASSAKGVVNRMTKRLDTEAYTFNAPLVLVGETYLNETATIERSIIFKFYKESNDTPEAKEAFYRLCDNEKLLNKLGKSILSKIMTFDLDSYSKIYNIAKANDTVKYAENQRSQRVATNTIQLVFSIFVLRSIMDDLGLGNELMDGDEVNKMLDAVHNIIYYNSLNAGKKNLSDSDKVMEVIGRMIENRELLREEDFSYKYDNKTETSYLAIRLRRIHDRYSKYVKDHKILDAESMSYGEFRQKIKMQPYYMTQKNVRFVNEKNPAKTDCFDLRVMEDAGIDFPYGDDE